MKIDIHLYIVCYVLTIPSLEKNVNIKSKLRLWKYYLDQKISGIYSENQKYKFINQNRHCPVQSTHHQLQALDPILETFFIFGFRFGHQSRLRFFHYLLLAAKTRSPERFFESTEQEEVAGSQISPIRWVMDGIRSVLGQKVADNDGIVCYVIATNRIFFLANCFTQTSQNILNGFISNVQVRCPSV